METRIHQFLLGLLSLERSSSLPFIFSSSSFCSVGWKQGRSPWGCQWSGSRSCCLSHQGFGGSPLHSCLTSAPQTHRCPARHAQRRCLLHFLEAPFSRGPSSKKGKHLPLYLGMEKNTELTSSKKGWNKARGIHHPKLADGLWTQFSFWFSTCLENMVVILCSKSYQLKTSSFPLSPLPLPHLIHLHFPQTRESKAMQVEIVTVQRQAQPWDLGQCYICLSVYWGCLVFLPCVWVPGSLSHYEVSDHYKTVAAVPRLLKRDMTPMSERISFWLSCLCVF